MHLLLLPSREPFVVVTLGVITDDGGIFIRDQLLSRLHVTITITATTSTGDTFGKGSTDGRHTDDTESVKEETREKTTAQ